MFQITGSKGSLATAQFVLQDLFDSGAVSDSYFQNVVNISKIVVDLISTIGNQRVRVTFTPTLNASDILFSEVPLAESSRDEFTLKHIQLLDRQGGSLSINVSKLVASGVDIGQFEMNVAEEIVGDRPFHVTLKRPNGGSGGDYIFKFLQSPGGENAFITIDSGDPIALTSVIQTIAIPVGVETMEVKVFGDWERDVLLTPLFADDTLVNLKDWGNKTLPKSLHCFFMKQTSFNQISAPSAPIFSDLTNLNYMFSNASTFNQDISNWDTSKVIDMNYMFNNALNFNQDISNWNVSNVTKMSGMFYYATSFNQDISNWNVMNVTEMHFMFSHASVFDQDLRDWCVAKVTKNPTSFSLNSGLTKYPLWGQCPRGENQ